MNLEQEPTRTQSYGDFLLRKDHYVKSYTKIAQSDHKWQTNKQIRVALHMWQLIVLCCLRLKVLR